MKRNNQVKQFMIKIITHMPLYFVPDKLYLKLLYKLECGRTLNLEQPISYNEKVQWLKIYDKNPAYVNLADKYEVKKIVSKMIGEKYIIPTYGIWNKFSEINFSKLPDEFVLKCTHNSGGVKIIRKMDFNYKKEKEFFNKCMKKNFFWYYREWVYKDIKPRIIAEKYIGTDKEPIPNDYKIFCFNGKPKLIQVDFDRFQGHKRNLYTIDWKYLRAEIKYPCAPERKIPKPIHLDDMLAIAEKLSKGMRHVRVDLYNIDGKIYFGEMTFYHGSGMEKFYPESFGKKMGKWLEISENPETN